MIDRQIIVPLNREQVGSHHVYLRDYMSLIPCKFIVNFAFKTLNLHFIIKEMSTFQPISQTKFANIF